MKRFRPPDPSSIGPGRSSDSTSRRCALTVPPRPRGHQCQPASYLRRQSRGPGRAQGHKPRDRRGLRGAAGLSLGEYTALTFASSFDFETGLKIVRRRGEAMQAAALATPSGMTSVIGLDEAKIDELCQKVEPHGRLWKANMLGPGNIVVSGEVSALAQVEAMATELGAGRVVSLAVAGAFHSPLMHPADEQLAELLASATIESPRIPVYSECRCCRPPEP